MLIALDTSNMRENGEGEKERMRMERDRKWIERERAREEEIERIEREDERHTVNSRKSRTLFINYDFCWLMAAEIFRYIYL